MNETSTTPPIKSNLVRYRCKYCSSVFEKAEQLISHKKQIHVDEIIKIKRRKKAEAVERIADTNNGNSQGQSHLSNKTLNDDGNHSTRFENEKSDVSIEDIETPQSRISALTQNGTPQTESGIENIETTPVSVLSQEEACHNNPPIQHIETAHVSVSSQEDAPQMDQQIQNIETTHAVSVLIQEQTIQNDPLIQNIQTQHVSVLTEEQTIQADPPIQNIETPRPHISVLIQEDTRQNPIAPSESRTISGLALVESLIERHLYNAMNKINVSQSQTTPCLRRILSEHNSSESESSNNIEGQPYISQSQVSPGLRQLLTKDNSTAANYSETEEEASDNLTEPQLSHPANSDPSIDIGSFDKTEYVFRSGNFDDHDDDIEYICTTRNPDCEPNFKARYTEVYKCDQCSYTTLSLYKAKAHGVVHFQPENPNPNPPIIHGVIIPSNITLLPTITIRPYACDYCPAKFSNESQYRSHAQEVHKNESISPHVVMPQHFQSNSTTPQTQGNSTQIQGMTFYRGTQESPTAANHNQMNPLTAKTSRSIYQLKKQCELCDKYYYSAINLKDHYDEAHPLHKSNLATDKNKNSTRFPSICCTQCEFKSKALSDVQQHFVSMHLGTNRRQQQRFFKCPSCPFASESKRDLSLHLMNAHGKSATFLTQKACDPLLNGGNNSTIAFERIQNNPIPSNSGDGRRINNNTTSLRNVSLLEKKLREHSAPASLAETFICSMCNGVYDSLDNLVLHVEIVHKNPVQDNQNPGDISKNL